MMVMIHFSKAVGFTTYNRIQIPLCFLSNEKNINGWVSSTDNKILTMTYVSFIGSNLLVTSGPQLPNWRRGRTWNPGKEAWDLPCQKDWDINLKQPSSSSKVKQNSIFFSSFSWTKNNIRKHTLLQVPGHLSTVPLQWNWDLAFLHETPPVESL